MYRADVFLWIVTIWATLLMQVVIMYSIARATGGNVFGFSMRELSLFFGIAILATGIAQSFVQGVVLHLSRAVITGQFDSWLLHPVSLFMRMLLEDLGIIWFWPHFFIGTTIIFLSASISAALFAIFCAVFAAIMEVGFMIAFGSFAIRWSAWNPDSFLWEYLEQARSVPVARSGSNLLVVASLGVLQYSIAIEVVTGGLPLFVLIATAASMIVIAYLCVQLNVRYYSSASG